MQQANFKTQLEELENVAAFQELVGSGYTNAKLNVKNEHCYIVHEYMFRII